MPFATGRPADHSSTSTTLHLTAHLLILIRKGTGLAAKPIGPRAAPPQHRLSPPSRATHPLTVARTTSSSPAGSVTDRSAVRQGGGRPARRNHTATLRTRRRLPPPAQVRTELELAFEGVVVGGVAPGDLDVQYKTAFVLMHKLREVMAAETRDMRLTGHVEVDGAAFGGHVRPANARKDRVDRRLLQNRSGKRRVVVALRQRGGSTLTRTFLREAEGARKRQAGPSGTGGNESDESCTAARAISSARRSSTASS